jgi:hypothetical protein
MISARRRLQLNLTLAQIGLLVCAFGLVVPAIQFLDNLFRLRIPEAFAPSRYDLWFAGASYFGPAFAAFGMRRLLGVIRDHRTLTPPVPLVHAEPRQPLRPLPRLVCWTGFVGMVLGSVAATAILLLIGQRLLREGVTFSWNWFQLVTALISFTLVLGFPLWLIVLSSRVWRLAR